MGNNNSASFNTRPPPKWTQSLPRDAHRNKRNIPHKQGPKVLPERIPGQRLRPTENGRILHFKGTITHRKLDESISMPVSTAPAPLSHHHSTSMTALNFHPEVSARGGNEIKYKSNYSPPRKVFTSEPDLREMEENQSYQPQPMVHESSTKGKILSKKRYKAPAPPPLGERVDFNGYEARISPKNESRALSPIPKLNKKGLFKKKNDNRPAIVHDHVNNVKLNEEYYRKTHSSSPVDIKGSQNELSSRNIPPNSHHMPNNLRSSSQIRASSLERDQPDPKISEDMPPTLERKPKSKHKTGLHGAYSFRDDERENTVASRSSSNKYIDQPPHQPAFHLRKNKENESSMDAWDRAEQEWNQKKKNSEIFQQEILDAAKNLKKTKSNEKSEPISLPKETNKITSDNKEVQPKTFFFGMAPDSKDEHQPKEPMIERNHKDMLSEEQHNSVSKIREFSEKEYHNALNDTLLSAVGEENEEENHISKKIDEFVATIERTKQKLKPSKSELLSSISGEDGGYHSRQSSGSGHNESEKDDEITMKLRPMLPKRQLELPRFSPNAAWRSLGIETSHKLKETNSESLDNPELFHLNEEKIHRYSRQLPPSRGSGEKSADSGISGDAGSPGIGQEFDHSSLKKHDDFQGPLAVSSPLSSSKLNCKRAWTPAQDLDDNSFEDSGDQGSKSVQHDSSTFPKLTSRSNMFSQSMQRLHKNKGGMCFDPTKPREYKSKMVHNGTQQEEGFTVSYTTKIINKSNDDEDLWRENWSLSRSIPNSLNTDEPDRVSSSSHALRSRSESRMSNHEKSNQRPITPSYLQHGETGHIMYLPEYRAYQMKKSSKMRENGSIDQDRLPYSNENFRKSASDLTKVMQDDKKKKFAYKSTIRMLEKRWLEEKLAKEVKGKEERRVQEMDEIMKVEQEFKNKREREKKKIKKQLKQYQSGDKHSPRYQSVINISNDSESYIIENGIIDKNHPSYIKERDNHSNNYHSLQTECPHNYSDTVSEPSGLFSGIKKWMKGKKDSKNGDYASDASSTTLTSGSRQEPDGAPASNKKANDNFRGEIIAAARSRNGSVAVGSTSQSPDSEHERNKYPNTADFSSDVHSSTSICTSEGSFEYKDSRYIQRQNQSVIGRRYMRKYSKSPAASESSRTSHSRRTVSPDSRRSSSSDPARINHEISETNEERRQYKEYRQAMRNQLKGKSYKEFESADNYRKNFAYGQPPMKGYMDEIDRYSKHSNTSRNSKVSSSSSKKNYSIDSFDNEKHRRNPFRHNYPYSYRSSSIDSSPARFVQNHLTPFGQQKSYRPVVYNSSPSNKVLVT